MAKMHRNNTFRCHTASKMFGVQALADRLGELIGNIYLRQGRYVFVVVCC